MKKLILFLLIGFFAGLLIRGIYIANAHGTNLWEHFDKNLPSIEERGAMYKRETGLNDPYLRTYLQNQTLLSALHQDIVLGAFPVLNEIQGGTGTGTVGVSQVGDCLQILDDSPFEYTFGDCSGGSGSQTPWTSDIDADGYDLSDLGNLTATSGQWLLGTTSPAFSRPFAIQGGGFFAGNLTAANIHATGTVTGATIQSFGGLFATGTSEVDGLLTLGNGLSSVSSSTLRNVVHLTATNATTTNATTTSLYVSDGAIFNGASTTISGTLQGQVINGLTISGTTLQSSGGLFASGTAAISNILTLYNGISSVSSSTLRNVIHFTGTNATTTNATTTSLYVSGSALFNPSSASTTITGTTTLSSGLIVGKGIQLSTYTSCTALETDTSGLIQCGSDATGGSATPWTSDIDAAGYDLLTVGGITATSGQWMLGTTTPAFSRPLTVQGGAFFAGNLTSANFHATGTITGATIQSFGGLFATGTLAVDGRGGFFGGLGVATTTSARAFAVHGDSITSGTSTSGGLFATSSLRVGLLSNCDTVDTDATGHLKCGTDGGSSVIGGFTQIATTTSISIDVCDTTYPTTSLIALGVGNENITVTMSGSACKGKFIFVDVWAPMIHPIGTTTFNGVYWDGQINPGSAVVLGWTDKFRFTVAASSTTFIEAKLESGH